jgi:hypothetical protein
LDKPYWDEDGDGVGGVGVSRVTNGVSSGVGDRVGTGVFVDVGTTGVFVLVGVRRGSCGRGVGGVTGVGVGVGDSTGPCVGVLLGDGTTMVGNNSNASGVLVGRGTTALVVACAVGVKVAVGTDVSVGVRVGVAVREGVGVAVGVSVGVPPVTSELTPIRSTRPIIAIATMSR